MANVIVTYGSSYENRDNLAPAFFEQIINRYEGTRLGRQEINAELLEDMPGALWTRSLIEDCRVINFPVFVRVVVAIDPEATSSESSAETGIMVAAKGEDGHGYLLDDASLRATPNGWAMAAVAAYNKHQADRMVAESNNGGEMVAATIEAVPHAPVVGLLHASKGKQARAEPIAALYERHRIHHVGFYPELEDQLCMWAPGEGQPSPDRLDALVWAFTELDIAVQGAGPGVIQSANVPVPSRFVKSQPVGGRWNRTNKTGYR
jgi:phage terminase large subunit-like protein